MQWSPAWSPAAPSALLSVFHVALTVVFLKQNLHCWTTPLPCGRGPQDGLCGRALAAGRPHFLFSHSEFVSHQCCVALCLRIAVSSYAFSLRCRPVDPTLLSGPHTVIAWDRGNGLVPNPRH